MESVPVTRLSSKGQIVIPLEVRKRLQLKVGSKFIVLESDGNLILKQIERPDIARFDALLKSARKRARELGLKQSDVAKAIDRVRSRGRKAA